jgi:hypothetical protein
VRDDGAAKKLGRIMEEIRPEVAYFTAQDDKRGGYLIYNLKEASERPKLAEPGSCILSRPSSSCR